MSATIEQLKRYHDLQMNIIGESIKDNESVYLSKFILAKEYPFIDDLFTHTELCDNRVLDFMAYDIPIVILKKIFYKAHSVSFKIKDMDKRKQKLWTIIAKNYLGQDIDEKDVFDMFDIKFHNCDKKLLARVLNISFNKQVNELDTKLCEFLENNFAFDVSSQLLPERMIQFLENNKYVPIITDTKISLKNLKTGKIIPMIVNNGDNISIPYYSLEDILLQYTNIIVTQSIINRLLVISIDGCVFIFSNNFRTIFHSKICIGKLHISSKENYVVAYNTSHIYVMNPRTKNAVNFSINITIQHVVTSSDEKMLIYTGIKNDGTYIVAYINMEHASDGKIESPHNTFKIGPVIPLCYNQKNKILFLFPSHNMIETYNFTPDNWILFDTKKSHHICMYYIDPEIDSDIKCAMSEDDKRCVIYSGNKQEIYNTDIICIPGGGMGGSPIAYVDIDSNSCRSYDQNGDFLHDRTC